MPPRGPCPARIQGSTLSGTLVNNEAGQSANFSITLAADGHSFSGTFTVVGGSTGQWRSACSGGACLSNAAPPPRPPGRWLPGGTDGSERAAGRRGRLGPVGPATALAPGGEMVATSPPIGRSQREATVAVSGDRPDRLTSVTPVKQRAHDQARGECVVAAVVQVGTSTWTGRSQMRPASDSDEVLYEFTSFMIACLDYLDQLERRAQGAALSTAGGARPTVVQGAPASAEGAGRPGREDDQLPHGEGVTARSVTQAAHVLPQGEEREGHAPHPHALSPRTTQGPGTARGRRRLPLERCAVHRGQPRNGIDRVGQFVLPPAASALGLNPINSAISRNGGATE